MAFSRTVQGVSMDRKKKLLIVAHAPSPNTLTLRNAVAQGAGHEDIENVEVTVIVC